MPPTEVNETIEESTKLFDTKVGHLYQDSETMELDVDSDSVLSNEESKDDEPI